MRVDIIGAWAWLRCACCTYLGCVAGAVAIVGFLEDGIFREGGERLFFLLDVGADALVFSILGYGV